MCFLFWVGGGGGGDRLIITTKRMNAKAKIVTIVIVSIVKGVVMKTSRNSDCSQFPP